MSTRSLADKVIVITGASDGTGVDVTVAFPGVVATDIRLHGYRADGRAAGRSGLKEDNAMSVEECARIQRRVRTRRTCAQCHP